MSTPPPARWYDHLQNQKQANFFTTMGKQFLHGRGWVRGGGAAAEKQLAKYLPRMRNTRPGWMLNSAERAVPKVTDAIGAKARLRTAGVTPGTGIGGWAGQHWENLVGKGPMKGVMGLAAAPLRHPGAALMGAGLAYGPAYQSGAETGAAKTIRQFEERPAWQSMLYGLPNILGHREAMGDAALHAAGEAQKNKGFFDRLMGPNYSRVQKKLDGYRQQSAPTTMQNLYNRWQSS